MITLIWAQDEVGVIGHCGGLPWHCPDDLKHFKATTVGHTVVMGATTAFSLRKPLPNRRNLVMTLRNARKLRQAGFETIMDTFPVLLNRKQSDIFVIGGAQIYKEFLPFADRLIVTFIKGLYPGDTYMPYVDYDLYRNNWTNNYPDRTVETFIRNGE